MYVQKKSKYISSSDIIHCIVYTILCRHLFSIYFKSVFIALWTWIIHLQDRGGRGYHPVRVSKVYSQGYVVIKKLGWGNFSTVWMVKDRWHNQKPSAAHPTHNSTGAGGSNHMQKLARKVQKSALHYTEAVIDKIKLNFQGAGTVQIPQK